MFPFLKGPTPPKGSSSMDTKDNIVHGHTARNGPIKNTALFALFIAK